MIYLETRIPFRIS